MSLLTKWLNISAMSSMSSSSASSAAASSLRPSRHALDVETPKGNARHAHLLARLARLVPGHEDEQPPPQRRLDAQRGHGRESRFGEPQTEDEAPRLGVDPVMAAVNIVIAGLMETGWALGLKYSEGFTRLWPSVVTIGSPEVSASGSTR